MAVAWCVHHYQRFLVGILTVLFCFNGSHSVVEKSGTCGTTIDLSLQTNNRIYSGILKVPLPESFARYQGATTRQEYCDIRILFGSGVHLQVELYYLDIVPISSNIKKCSTGLEVTDSAETQVYGGRLCMEGWRWEKEHREKKQEKRVVKSSPLRFRLISDGPYKGTGFKVHFNVFRPVWPCSNFREFKCERYERCVNEELTCDGWDDCGDDTDEDEEAGCDLLTVSEIFAVIIGVFLFVGTVAASVVFMIKYRRIIKRNRLMRMESKLALDDERRSMQEPVLSFPHRFNSMESMNKSQYSRTPGQKLDIDSLMDRMELDKAERLSYRDNMSERSHKSHRNKSYDNSSDRYGPSSRKNRAPSQSSLTKEKAGVVGSSNHGSRPDLNKDATEKDGREDDRRSERRRSKERRRYSDEDDDYDSDRERRRRRRSRDRRRYDRSDDEDYDSDRDRRRRSRDRYDSDEENDSDRERRRRRRSRDRRRYDSDDDSDSERRRRRSKDRPRDDKNSDEENGSDRESRRKRSRDRRRYSDDEYDSDRDRRRRSRDRRRHDSDENDSDRGRRRRRSQDRRSKDLSDTKDEKDQSQPRQSSEEPNMKPPTEKESDRDRQPPVGNNGQREPYHEKERPRKAEELPVQKQRAPDLQSAPAKYKESPPEKHRAPTSHRGPDDYPRPSTPPKSEQLQQRYNKAPQSNNVPPKDTNGTAWVPRSERKKNRRSRGEPNDAIYEDVVPKVVLENLGFREEAV